MIGGIPARGRRLAAVAAVAMAALTISAGTASAENEVVYNNVPAGDPGNVVSLGFEATSTAQFGGLIELGGANRNTLGSVIIGMSSWACEKGTWQGSPECVTAAGARFPLAVTLRVNAVGPGNSVGPLITSVTKTFNIRYRPSQNNKKCTGEAAGGWWSAIQHACFHGRFTKLVFPVKGFIWPSKAIVSVSYNTSDYGAEPQRPKPCNSEPQGCPYDSLNVGLSELAESPTPAVGSYPLPTSAYLNTSYAPNYCDGGAGGTGTFRLDSGCWEYQPLIEVKATP